jgi:hypothetical protein
MGEIQRHVHSLNTDQFDAIFGVLLRAATPLPAESAASGNRNPYDIGLEPWAFHDPGQKCDVVAYIDDRNQVRHVPVNRSSEVPKAWRRVWLEDRR